MLALLGAHHILHVSRVMVKVLVSMSNDLMMATTGRNM